MAQSWLPRGKRAALSSGYTRNFFVEFASGKALQSAVIRGVDIKLMVQLR